MKEKKQKQILLSAFVFSVCCVLGIVHLSAEYRGEAAPSLFPAEEEADEAAGGAEKGDHPPQAEQADGSSNGEKEGEEKLEAKLYPVYLTGAVCREGIYLLEDGAYLYELIEEAGGFRPDAAQEALNLAARVEGESHIRIPTLTEWRAGGGQINVPSKDPPASASSQLIDINTADAEELQKLPGIGEKTAADIIAYREETGSFSCKEDLMQVPGIKEGRFARLEALIRAG